MTMPEQVFTAHYGTSIIHYHLEHRRRKTLAIEVHPDGAVRVMVPPGTPLETVAQKVSKRARWILRQQREFAQYPPLQPPKAYQSGETHRYLGRQYRLKVVQGSPVQVKLSRGWLEVHSPDPARVGPLLERWFRLRAETVITERMGVVLERLKPHGLTHSGEFQLKKMDKRWGSCTAEGRIYLNPRLIAAPKDCIDYVLTHELCHTRIHRHSSAFYALLSKCLPDWKETRARLNRLVELEA